MREEFVASMLRIHFNGEDKSQGMPLQEATALEFQRVFTSEVVPSGLEALIVSAPAARGRTVS